MARLTIEKLSHFCRKHWSHCLSSFLAIVAVYLSFDANCTASKALLLSREEYERQQETRVVVDVEWVRNDIFISEMRPYDATLSHSEQMYYSGVAGFAVVKLTNTSAFAVSVDRVRVFYGSGNSTIGNALSDYFLDPDLTQAVRYPLRIASGESSWLFALVPIPVSQQVAARLSTLHANSVHSGERVLDALNENTSDSAAATLKNWLLATMPTGYRGVETRHARMPWWLIVSSDENKFFRKADRTLKVYISLASGTTIDTLIDYVDISGSTFDM